MQAPHHLLPETSLVIAAVLVCRAGKSLVALFCAISGSSAAEAAEVGRGTQHSCHPLLDLLGLRPLLCQSLLIGKQVDDLARLLAY